MKKYEYKKVDAFTSGISLGNPAAYIYTGKDILSPEKMLAIGKEHSGFVSEFIFCSSSDKAEVKLTYYSSECEVDFCGHGTIATLYDLIKNDERLRTMPEIKFETNKKGTLTAYNSIDKEDSIYITAPKAEWLDIPGLHAYGSGASDVNKSNDVKNTETEFAIKTANALDLAPIDYDKGFSLDAIDAGLRTLIVPIESFEKEISVYPDIKTLKTFCEDIGVDIVLIFCMKTLDNTCFAHTRVFAPRFGYLEDPATGSGNSAFGNYLLTNKLWDGSPIIIEQGGNNRKYNNVRLRCEENNVLFGGGAAVRIQGLYFLEEGDIQ